MALGRLPVEQFLACEVRRAANRLRDAWKKNPWVPGSTIDLGEHEAAFQTESGLARVTLPVAPAVLDWFRWKFRRLQVDLRQDREWARARFVEFPRRHTAAGDAPPDFDPQWAGHQPAAKWTAAVPSPRSRRSRADRPKIVVREDDSPEPHGGGSLPPDDGPLALFLYENRDVLRPLLSKCTNERERTAVVSALWEYLSNPTRPSGPAKWFKTVETLMQR